MPFLGNSTFMDPSLLVPPYTFAQPTILSKDLFCDVSIDLLRTIRSINGAYSGRPTVKNHSVCRWKYQSLYQGATHMTETVIAKTIAMCHILRAVLQKKQTTFKTNSGIKRKRRLPNISSISGKRSWNIAIQK
jgi:hypothetical protein